MPVSTATAARALPMWWVNLYMGSPECTQKPAGQNQVIISCEQSYRPSNLATGTEGCFLDHVLSLMVRW